MLEKKKRRNETKNTFLRTVTLGISVLSFTRVERHRRPRLEKIIVTTTNQSVAKTTGFSFSSRRGRPAYYCTRIILQNVDISR